MNGPMGAMVMADYRAGIGFRCIKLLLDYGLIAIRLEYHG